MFPYRPKMPMFGTKLAKKIHEREQEKNSNSARDGQDENGDGNGRSSFTPAAKKDQRIKHLMHGGPVQRAIKADLLLLRARFYRDYTQEMKMDRIRQEVLNSSNNGSRTTSCDTSQHGHSCRGRTFRIFKKTFQDAKFAIIHTRCCPPKCDRDSFIQLIYATVLDMLRDASRSCANVGNGHGDLFDEAANDGNENRDENENNNEDEDGNLFFHAIFAIFSLYTIYETNPLPSVPIIEKNVISAAASSLDDTDKMKNELLSTLSLGLNSDEDGFRKYRRCYRSPIRIDMEHHSLLYIVRQWAFGRMDDCQLQLMGDVEKRNIIEAQKIAVDSGDDGSSDGEDSVSMNEQIHRKTHTETAIDNSNNLKTWQCECGLAGDCIYIIDRLRSNASFQLCEYPGPVSLEGLAGSKNYYHTVVLKEESNATATDHDATLKLKDLLSRPNAAKEAAKRTSIDSSDDGSIDSSENSRVDNADDNWEHFNFSSLQSYQQKYHNVLGNIAGNLARNNVQDRPSRQLQLVKTTMIPILDRRNMRQLVRSNDLVSQLEEIKDGTHVNHANGINGHELDSPGSRVNDEYEEKTTTFATIANVNIDSRNATSDRREPTSQAQQLHLKCPIEFAEGLKLGIEKALKDVQFPSTRQDAAGARNRNHGAAFNSWLVEMEDETVVQEHTGEVYDQDEESVRRDKEEEMDISLAGDDTGMQGLNALEHLLSRVSKQRSQKKNRLSSSKAKQGDHHHDGEKEDYIESDDESMVSEHTDINSLATQRGRQALETLLSAVSMKKSQPKKRVQYSGRSIDDESVASGLSSIATGHGRQALETLLSSVSERKTALKRKRQMDEEKGRGGRDTDEHDARSVAKSVTFMLESDIDEYNMANEDDTVSISTLGGNGTGYNALQKLLDTADKSKKAVINDKMPPPPRRKSDHSGKRSPPLTSQKKKPIVDDASVESDSTSRDGQRQDALRILVETSNASQNKKESPKVRSQTSTNQKRRIMVDDASNESDSTFGIVNSADGCGQNALKNLLQKANASRNKNKSPPKRHSIAHKETKSFLNLKSKLCGNKSDSDSEGSYSVDQSIATTGPGSNALDALLSKVKK